MDYHYTIHAQAGREASVEYVLSRLAIPQMPGLHVCIYVLSTARLRPLAAVAVVLRAALAVVRAAFVGTEPLCMP